MIDRTVRSITVEVAVRDHPGNAIFGQKTAQLVITLCNQAPVVEQCYLGELEENSAAGTVLLNTDIKVIDNDVNYLNSIVGFEVTPTAGGSVQKSEHTFSISSQLCPFFVYRSYFYFFIIFELCLLV